ncbi:hypothetical protein LIT25_08895 [Bacillus sp. F19]|nr:hypothetical protein LIT25_08895 [Bacillus sp. F19]
MLHEKKVTLRRLKPEDIPLLWEFINGQTEPEWKKWMPPFMTINCCSTSM